MERKHRTLKRSAQSRHNTSNFDRSVVEECTVQHLHDLRAHRVVGVDLLSPKPTSKKVRDEL
eukprot:5861396-Pyramimonas_sp.AAC.1